MSDAPERGWTQRQPTPLPGSCCALYVFVRRWGGPSPVLAPCLACLPREPRVLVPLWHHQGNPMFQCCNNAGSPCGSRRSVVCTGYPHEYVPAWYNHVKGFLAGRNPSPSAWRRRGCFSSMPVHVLSLSLFRKGGGSALTPPPTKTEALSFFLEPKSSGA